MFWANRESPRRLQRGCWEQKGKERKKYPFPMPTGGRHVLGANLLTFRRIGNGRFPCPTLGEAIFPCWCFWHGTWFLWLSSKHTYPLYIHVTSPLKIKTLCFFVFFFETATAYRTTQLQHWHYLTVVESHTPSGRPREVISLYKVSRTFLTYSILFVSFDLENYAI
jgi:hypothetical protein